MPSYPNTFWSLIQENSVQIPLIQRDYAQGREEAQRTALNFLRNLKKALETDDAAPVELDFIYGDIDETGNGKVFKPLDGQQRLTTLYLLHWYFANQAGKLTDECISTLQKFSYQTRISSRDFCKHLSACNIVLADVIAEPGEDDISLADKIKDFNWYLLAWNNDPTVTGMLNMLNLVHREFHTLSGGWERLSSWSKVTFKFLPLKDFGLEDDLYIKMNDRGVQLTGLENLKAQLINKIETENWEQNLSSEATFGFRLDTAYTDVFWSIAAKPEEIDACINRYIKAIVTCRLCAANRMERVRKITGKDGLVYIEDIDQDIFMFLKKSFDALVSCHSEVKKESIKLFNLAENGKDIISQIALTDNPRFQQLGLFAAVTAYLNNLTAYNTEQFTDFTRVVRNICLNERVDEAERLSGFLKLANELTGNTPVYEYLAANNIRSDFGKAQVSEEKKKAGLLTADKENKATLFAAEDLPYVKGKISLLFSAINYENDREFDVDKFILATTVCKNHLSTDPLSNDIRRMLLTCVDFRYYNYRVIWSYNLDLHKRQLFEDLQTLWSHGNSTNSHARPYIIELIQKLMDNETKHIEPPEFCKNYVQPPGMPAWEYKLITEPRWLDDHARFPFMFATDEKTKCLLFGHYQRPQRDDCTIVE